MEINASPFDEKKAALRKSYDSVSKGIRCPQTGCNGVIGRIVAKRLNVEWRLNESGNMKGKWTVSLGEPKVWLLCCSINEKHFTEYANEELPEDFLPFKIGPVVWKPAYLQTN